MKLKNVFITLGVCAAMGFGAFAGLKAGKGEFKEAKAGTAQNVFIDLTACTGSGDWTEANAVVKLRLFNGTLLSLTQVSGKYYKVNADISGGCQLVRIDPNNSSNIWTYGSDNTSSHNLCVVSGYTTNWSTVSGADETYEIANTTPSTTTKRIWVDPKDNFYDGSARAGLRTFSGSTHLKTYILGGSSQYTTVSGNTLFYVDIPLSADCQLVRLHNVYNYVWTFGGNFSDIKNYKTCQVVYSWAADAGYSAANESAPTIAYAKLVLDGYSTCENSNVNGYKAISDLETNIFSKLSSADLSSLRSTTFTATGGYGTRTYGDKIDLMTLKNSGGSSSTILNPFTSNESNTAIIIVIASTISLLALAGFFFIKRKKESK